MRQLWKFVIFTAILSVCDVCAERTNQITTPIEYVTTTIAPITTTTIASISDTIPTNASEPLPILAAKLVRQRRQHPYTVVRHVMRSAKRGTKSRRRHKYPKYKYGPLSHSGGQQIIYYKPTKQYLPELSDPPKYSPIVEWDLTSHSNSADYEVRQPSGNHYEHQAMDLDFYSHTGNAYQESPQVHHIEYSSYDGDKELPIYAYTSTKTESRKPLRTYNVPKKRGGAYEMSSSSSGDSGLEDTHTFTPPENTYDMHAISSYDKPASPMGNKFYEYTSPSDTSSHSDVHIPAAKYGVPDLNIPLQYSPPTKQSDYHAPKPSTGNSYNVYDKKIPNAGYSSSKVSGHHNFAEPPTKTNVEITYSPSYEITLPPANQKPAPVEIYHHRPGNFAEPPAHPPSTYNGPRAPAQPPATYHVPEPPAPPSYSAPEPPPPPPPSYQIPECHTPSSYEAPESHEPPSYETPESHELPSYETPESHGPPSYETPESHRPPSYETPESHGPPSYDDTPQTYQVPASPAPPSYEAPQSPIHPPTGSFEVSQPQPPPLYSPPESPLQPPATYGPPDPEYTSTSAHSEYPRPDYISPSKNLPINSNYMSPAYDYPKSSYEVPIYDPIPFEASSTEEHETYPPHTIENHHINGHTQSASSPAPTLDAPEANHPTSSEEAAPPSSTTNGRRTSNKRKRMRNSTPAVTTKHILDTPELKEAFEASQRHKNHLALNNDADVDESNHVQAQPNREQINHFLPTISPDTSNEHSYVSTAWNPIRIRGSSAPTVLPAAKEQTQPASTSTIVRPKGRRQYAAHGQQPVVKYTSASAATSTRQTAPLSSGSEQIAIVSVDKSRSYSYYGGTSTPANVSEHTLYRTRPNLQRQPTRTPVVTRQKVSARDETVPHRTTKSVFETTYFKSPRNEDLERHLSTIMQNLPKNHKLF